MKQLEIEIISMNKPLDEIHARKVDLYLLSDESFTNRRFEEQGAKLRSRPQSEVGGTAASYQNLPGSTAKEKLIWQQLPPLAFRRHRYLSTGLGEDVCGQPVLDLGDAQRFSGLETVHGDDTIVGAELNAADVPNKPPARATRRGVLLNP